jgi:hypothetical protein
MSVNANKADWLAAGRRRNSYRGDPSKLTGSIPGVVRLYPLWSPAVSDREISIDGKPYTIEAVCDLVSTFDDKLPPDLLELLSSKMGAQNMDVQEDLEGHKSYASGGRCLRKLMDRRKANYQHSTGN